VEIVQVVGIRPAWGLPSSSPFCLKLETWLRMEKIPYRPIALTKPPRSNTGKVPYILRADGSTVADSNFIINTIAKEFSIDPAHGATAEERARTHLIIRTLEESLYFVAVWERWWQAEYWPTTREAMFGYLPPLLRQLLAMIIRRKMLTSLQGQGIARHDPARIAAIGQADLIALSSLLGERPYFHGDKPGLADASAYGTLANLLAFPHSTPLKRVLERHKNLIDFCGRMKNAFWSEAAW
jgi:glutathione S-transferase